jgi:hypothetical protein
MFLQKCWKVWKGSNVLTEHRALHYRIALPTRKVKTMSNSFTNSAAQIADMSVSYASVSEARDSVTKLAKSVATIDKTIELKRGDKASLIIASLAGMKLVMDNDAEESSPVEQGVSMGIVAGTVSMARCVGSIASYVRSGFDDGSKFNSLTEEQCSEYAKRIEAWYNLETAGDPSAISSRLLLSGLMSLDGEARMVAIQSVRETFGSISKIYTIAKGTCVHPDTPEVEDEDGDEDGDEPTTWQGMLSRALDTARKQGASETEIMFIVRAFNNEV